MPEKTNKSARGNASQFFVAGELCRRGYCAVVTLGNSPNTDVLCSDLDGERFVHIQVKTFAPGHRTCSVGIKAQRYYGDNFFWVLAGIPLPQSSSGFEYHVIPSKIMAEKITEENDRWLQEPGRKGQEHNASDFRVVRLPPYNKNWWSVEEFRDKWNLIETKLNTTEESEFTKDTKGAREAIRKVHGRRTREGARAPSRAR